MSVHAPACAVPRREAERVRALLQREALIDDHLDPVREDDTVYFPLKGRSGVQEFPVVERVFPERPQRTARYQDLVSLPSELHAMLPAGYDVVGDIVVVRLDDALTPHRREIGTGLLRFVPHARVVAVDRGVHGETRVRSLETIAGEGPLSTTHRENGLQFRVDMTRAYFSPRLSLEHTQVFEGARDGEVLLDLFCGIGPFSLTFLSRHPRGRAVAVDLNPSAIELLKGNALRQGVSNRLEAKLEEAEAFLARAGTFDRVVMNLPREGYKYVKLVAPHVKSPGWLHFYALVPREPPNPALPEPYLPTEGAAGSALREILGPPATQEKWTLRERREVHAYSPSLVLERFTLERT